MSSWKGTDIKLSFRKVLLGERTRASQPQAATMRLRCESFRRCGAVRCRLHSGVSKGEFARTAWAQTTMRAAVGLRGPQFPPAPENKGDIFVLQAFRSVCEVPHHVTYLVLPACQGNQGRHQGRPAINSSQPALSGGGDSSRPQEGSLLTQSQRELQGARPNSEGKEAGPEVCDVMRFAPLTSLAFLVCSLWAASFPQQPHQLLFLPPAAPEGGKLVLAEAGGRPPSQSGRCDGGRPLVGLGQVRKQRKGDAGAQRAFFRIPANAGVLFTLRAISSRLTVSGNALRVTPRGVPHQCPRYFLI